MPSKGTTKTGETFCMSCGAAVDSDARRCESCYSELDQEVKAFRCPRCDKVLELGTQRCPACSMKFKAKSLKPSDSKEDEKILSKLISMDRPGASGTAPVGGSSAEVPGLTPEEAAAVSGVIRELSDLADLRAEVASGMGTRLSEARERIARMSESSASALPLDDLESELASVAQDLGRIEELLSRARSLSEEIARTFSMSGPVRLAKGRQVGLKVAGPQGGTQKVTPEDLLEREEQLRKREEMVDRKIKAYAQKKKQLEAMEAGIVPGAGGVPAPAPAPTGEPEPRPDSLGSKVRSIHEILSPEGACDDLEPCLSSLEEHVRDVVVLRSELEQRISQLQEGEEEVRVLLKTLDGLLGQLPPEAVDRFSKSDEFRLYERVLDRLRV